MSARRIERARLRFGGRPDAAEENAPDEAAVPAPPAEPAGLATPLLVDRRGVLSLETLGEGAAPLTLERLNLSGCTRLSSLPDLSGLPALRSLLLRRCRCLSALPALPDALERLDARGCEALVTLPASMGRLPSLAKLTLAGCASYATRVAAV